MRLLIIGGDAAGMSAASQAKRMAPDAEVIVLEMTQDVSYGACGLPYKLPEGREMDDLQVITAERFREQRKIDVRLGHEVRKIMPDQHKVSGVAEGSPFELDYDKLIIATGARTIQPPIKGLLALWGKGAYPLKTLEDGRVLKVALDPKPATAVIIGGGYIGLEAAEGLHSLGIKLTIVEGLPHILPFLPEAQRQRVYKEAERQGVEVQVDTLVQSLAREPSGKIKLTTTAGEILTDLVLVATGVRPNSELAAEAGITLGAARSIAVNKQLETSAPDIFSAGDCADAEHCLTGQSVWIPLALRANRAGKLAGQNAMGGDKSAPPVMGTAVFKFFELEIARTGLSPQEATDAGYETAVAEILAATRAHYYPGGGKLSLWLLADKKTHKLLGATMVGPEAAAHKIDTVVACLHGGLTVEQLYEMDLAYAPPFGPSWSPLLPCASKLIGALAR